MTNPFQNLIAQLGLKLGKRKRSFRLETDMHTVLAERADQEQRPIEQIQAELFAAGLAHLQAADALKRCWETLSPRQQEVTALTCLGYTNRQIAARLHVSPLTVKGYVSGALVRWHVHGKDELRMLLDQWDFSDWGPPAQI